MISSNTISAPQLERGRILLREWQELTGGTLEEFYAFITTPSPDREAFLENRNIKIDLSGSVLIHTINGRSGFELLPGEVI